MEYHEETAAVRITFVVRTGNVRFSRIDLERTILEIWKINAHITNPRFFAPLINILGM